MGQVGDQVVFTVSFVFDGLLMPLHSGLDLDDLSGYLCVSRRKNVRGVKIVVHVSVEHAAGLGDRLLRHPASVVMRYQIDGEHIND